MFFKKKLSQAPKNIALRKKYAEDKKFRNKCKVRRQTYKISKLTGLCYLCGIRTATENHHPNYRKPKIFFPLCKQCHKRLHHISDSHRVKKEDE